MPIAALVDRPYTEADLQSVVVRVREKIAEGGYPYSIDDDVTDLRATIAALGDILIWAPGRVVWDDPASIKETGEAGDMVAALRKKLGTVREALIIESAYFVVGDNGVARDKALVDNGVRVRVLTNSLAYMDEGVLPENSDRLMLDDNGDLVWITENDGVEVRFDKDPLSTFGQRFMSGFIGILPVESQL